jgi:acetyl-CoA carboxylase/biotin carboxylase 1
MEDAEIDSLSYSPSNSNQRKKAIMESFVKKMGGQRAIQKVLIANNGMAATKAILSIRQWAYMVLGDERAVEFVAMATRDDLNANVKKK